MRKFVTLCSVGRCSRLAYDWLHMSIAWLRFSLHVCADLVAETYLKKASAFGLVLTRVCGGSLNLCVLGSNRYPDQVSARCSLRRCPEGLMSELSERREVSYCNGELRFQRTRIRPRER